MKRSMALIIILVGFLGLLAGSLLSRSSFGRGEVDLLPKAQAHESAFVQDNHQGCSNLTLEGKYGVTFNGNAPGFGPFVAVAVGSYDGYGHIQGSGTANVNGQVLQGSVTGNYTVKVDCTATGTITFAALGFSVSGFAVLVNDGKEGFFIGTAPAGVQLSGTIKKL